MAFQQQPQGISAASRPADYLQQYMNFGIAVTDSMKNDAAQLAAMGRQKWADETTQLKQLWTDKFNRTQTEEYMKAITEMLDKQQKLDEERLKNNEQNADNMKFKEEIRKLIDDKLNGDDSNNKTTKYNPEQIEFAYKLFNGMIDKFKDTKEYINNIDYKALIKPFVDTFGKRYNYEIPDANAQYDANIKIPAFMQEQYEKNKKDEANINKFNWLEKESYNIGRNISKNAYPLRRDNEALKFWPEILGL